MLCDICKKEAKKISLLAYNHKIYFADIIWYNGVISASKDYFSSRADTVIFGCSKKHLHEAIIRYLMLKKLDEK